MGFPVTQSAVNGGKKASFKFYVWFIDFPEGPIWKEMDERFDHWDQYTGEHVAFFVDPFQLEEWAREFLTPILKDTGLLEEVLLTKKTARHFFQKTMAELTVEALWLDRSVLPLALVALRSDAQESLAVRLPDRDHIAKLLTFLFDLSRQPAFINTNAPGYYRNLRDLESRLTKKDFQVRRMASFCGFSPLLKDLQSSFKSPLTVWLEQEWNNREIRNNSLETSVTSVAVSAMDSLMQMSAKFSDHVLQLKGQYPSDPMVQLLAKDLANFRTAFENLFRIREELRQITHSTLFDSASLDTFLEQGADRLLESTVMTGSGFARKRVIDLMGEEVFRVLQPKSRDALTASEALGFLAELLSELEHDLSGILLGYWKASEIEGRKLLQDLVIFHGKLAVQHRNSDSVDYQDDIKTISRTYTAGSIGITLQNLIIDEHQPALNELGYQYRKMSDVTRNRFIHRDNLSNPSEYLAARNLVALGPDGIIPRAVSLMNAINEQGNSGNGIPVGVSSLLTSLAKNNAEAKVRECLDILRGSARTAFAKAAIEQLGERWLKDSKRAHREWVTTLFKAAES